MNPRNSLFFVVFAFLFLFSTTYRCADAQIIVLGMHHSGTSAVTKMITMMGAQAGSEQELIVSSLKEFYERKDVVELNDLLFQHAGVYEENKRPTWVGYGFSPAILESKKSLLENFRERAEKVIIEHLADSGRTWVTKDPRLSLTIKYWLEVYDSLVAQRKIPNVEATCVVVHRDLFPMMKTLWKWSNDKPNGLSAEEWLEAWNAYMLSIGNACANRKIVLVRNVDAWDSQEYFENFQHLYSALSSFYPDLQLPSKAAIQEMASELTHPRSRNSDSEKYRAQVMQPVLGHLTTELLHQIEDGKFPIPDSSFSVESVWSTQYDSPESVLPIFTPAPTTFFGKAQVYLASVYDAVSNAITSLLNATTIAAPIVSSETSQKEAYVTLITGDNPLYMGLALTLAHSIRQHDQNRDIIALLVEGSVSKDWEPILKGIGYKVKYVETIPEPWLGKESISRCHAPQDIINRWGKLMTKLQTFKLVEYKKVIFLDSDIIMVSPADGVFEIEGFGGGSGNFGSEGLFNAGYMLIEPSKITFHKLLKLTTRAPPRLFDNILDCTEMGLLNQFYHNRLSLLPMASPYNVVKSPFVHWYGDHKPWENLDTNCYPSPYFSNKLWAQTWEDTVDAMKDFTGHELFQKAYKAVMDKRGVPSMIHSDKTPIFDKQNKDKKTSQDAVGVDAYAYGSNHGASSSRYYLEEERTQYQFYQEDHRAQNRFQYYPEEREKKVSSSSPYFEDNKASSPYFEDKKASSPYLEDKKASSPYLEDKKASSPYLEDKKASSPYLEERAQYRFKYADEKTSEKKFSSPDRFQYAEEEENRPIANVIHVVGK